MFHFQTGNCPSRFALAFVRNEAFNGHIRYNPYNFMSKFLGPVMNGVQLYFGIKSIDVTLDGNRVSGITGGFSQYDCMNEFVRFIDLTKPETSIAPNPMSYERYKVDFKL